MPKVSFTALPISALFAVNKPSGPSSMSIINDIKVLIASSRLFVPSSVLDAQKSKQAEGSHGNSKSKKRNKRNRDKGPDAVKIGQGGTLDPLADGVLVVGVGKGTKKLSEFLDCVKEYRTTCLLGCETDSYDSEGAQVRAAPWRHVTRETVEEALNQFRGVIQQRPPIFSALKMDGRPLYEYARQGIPLPRPIEKRPVTVHSLELMEWIGSEHGYKWPEKKFSDEERMKMEKALMGGDEKEKENAKDDVEDVKIEDDPRTEDLGEGDGVPAPTAFVLRMTVSGGTYVRSIVHDLGHAVGSAAHVVTLTRSRQGRFTLDEPALPSQMHTPEHAVSNGGKDKGSEVAETKVEQAGDANEGQGKGEEEDMDRGCVPWEVFAKAVEDPGERDNEGWYAWEKEVMNRLEFVEGGRGQDAHGGAPSTSKSNVKAKAEVGPAANVGESSS